MLWSGVLQLIMDGAAHETPSVVASEAQVAWAELRREVRAYVARKVAPADVDDVVQEILVAASRGGGARTGAYVHGVAKNHVAEHHRRRAREHARLARLAKEPEPEVEGEDPVTARLAMAIEAFLPALSPAYRTAIEEVDLRGRSQAEVARELGVPLSTLRTRVQRGRTELRRLFDLCCEIETDARGKPTSCEPRMASCDCTPGEAPD